MVAIDQLKNTGSPKVDVGEIDTVPLQALFGKRVLAKETKLHLAQKELNKLKERLKNAETLKVQALTELDVAQPELNWPLGCSLNAERIWQMKKRQGKIQVEVASDDVSKANDGSLKLDLETEREKYSVAITELDAAKQMLRNMQQIMTCSGLTAAYRSGANIRFRERVAQVEAVKASEKETMKRLEALQKEIVEMRTATQEALKKADTAEAAKRAVEGELKRWREQRSKRRQSGISEFWRILGFSLVLLQSYH
ncbi:hypothetical protein Leryth_013770 [Lithospermum erythrorhizon]|nr:hypothetical protein Leryth_013770 [Lithospermum erythrorhizon]